MSTLAIKILTGVAMTMLTLSPVVGCSGMSDRIQSKTLHDATATSDDRTRINKLVSELPPRPRLAALQMMAKYGLPQEATADKFVWHDAGPFKRINVTKAEHHHDFPLPHMDYLEHTIDYRVPAEKAAALSAYDGSLTFDRTRGEMSARCDLEGHNILTLNLAHDIVTGKKDTEEARQAFGHTVVEDFKGKYPADVVTLRVDPSKKGTTYADQPVIPGSPKRAATVTDDSKKNDDAEILAFVAVVDMNEILAADQATKEKVDAQVMQYAKKLHQEHGTNLEQTLMLGQRNGVTPILTPAVDTMRVKGATELATLVPLDGDQFGKAYLAAMIKGHTEVLAMLDTKLKDAESEAVKRHLTETRQHVTQHLEEARKLQTFMHD